RPMVEKFLAMSKLGEKSGMPKMRVMTDFSAERYWTLVSEMEVPSMKALEDMFSGQGQNEQDMKEFENIMKGYHDLVEYGRREIYKIESCPSVGRPSGERPGPARAPLGAGRLNPSLRRIRALRKNSHHVSFFALARRSPCRSVPDGGTTHDEELA